MRNLKFNKYKICLVIILTIVSMLFLGCTERNGDLEAQNNEDTSSSFISALDAFDQLKENIESWDSNFRIARIYHFGTSEYRDDAKEESWKFYVESSDGEKSTDFTFSIDSGAIKSMDTSYGTGRNTCSADDLKVDSTEATITALNAIRSELFPDFDGGSKAELSVNQNGTPYWEITANSRRKNGNINLDTSPQYGYVEVNAKTGVIMEISGDT